MSGNVCLTADETFLGRHGIDRVTVLLTKYRKSKGVNRSRTIGPNVMRSVCRKQSVSRGLVVHQNTSLSFGSNHHNIISESIHAVIAREDIPKAVNRRSVWTHCGCGSAYYGLNGVTSVSSVVFRHMKHKTNQWIGKHCVKCLCDCIVCAFTAMLCQHKTHDSLSNGWRNGCGLAVHSLCRHRNHRIDRLFCGQELAAY